MEQGLHKLPNDMFSFAYWQRFASLVEELLDVRVEVFEDEVDAAALGIGHDVEELDNIIMIQLLQQAYFA